jgi:hypothetical protein
MGIFNRYRNDGYFGFEEDPVEMFRLPADWHVGMGIADYINVWGRLGSVTRAALRRLEAGYQVYTADGILVPSEQRIACQPLINGHFFNHKMWQGVYL